MKEIIELLDSVVERTTFDAGDSRTLTSTDLREIYESDKLHGHLSPKTAAPNIPEDLFAPLFEKLHPLLGKYKEPESGNIGNGLVDLMGGPFPTSIDDFARILVKAAATLGPQRVAQLLFGWIEGEPLHYQTKALLSGVKIDQPLKLEGGLHITPLPMSLADTPTFLPDGVIPRQDGVFLGGVLLSIDCEAKPALYKPLTSEASPGKIKQTWAWGKILGLPLHTFCEALSLAYNDCVRWKSSWDDCGELQEFQILGGIGITHTDIPSFEPPTFQQRFLSQQHLEEARDIHFERHGDSKTDPRLDTAISRWIRSKRFNSSLSDSLIDLRVALEALYLDNAVGEMRFRLATNGAWHLGSNLAERRNYHKILSGAYKLASKAVHASEINFKKRDRELLATAQDACRKGILKRLKEKEAPNWNDLILGGIQQEEAT